MEEGAYLAVDQSAGKGGLHGVFGGGGGKHPGCYTG